MNRMRGGRSQHISVKYLCVAFRKVVFDLYNSELSLKADFK